MIGSGWIGALHYCIKEARRESSPRRRRTRFDTHPTRATARGEAPFGDVMGPAIRAEARYRVIQWRPVLGKGAGANENRLRNPGPA